MGFKSTSEAHIPRDKIQSRATQIDSKTQPFPTTLSKRSRNIFARILSLQRFWKTVYSLDSFKSQLKYLIIDLMVVNDVISNIFHIASVL